MLRIVIVLTQVNIYVLHGNILCPYIHHWYNRNSIQITSFNSDMIKKSLKKSGEKHIVKVFITEYLFIESHRKVCIYQINL